MGLVVPNCLSSHGIYPAEQHFMHGQKLFAVILLPNLGIFSKYSA